MDNIKKQPTDRVLEGQLVSSGGVCQGQVCFNEETGLIRAVGNLGLEPHYSFGDSCLIFAGMGDIHIHAREDVTGKDCYKEDFVSASAAAQAGGVTFALDMPNNPRPPVCTESYEEKMALITRASIPLFAYAGIGPGTRPLPYPVPYKVYMGPSVGELFFESKAQLKETLKHYRGCSVSFHCEDPEVLEICQTGATHGERRPQKAEVLATATALECVAEYGLRGKLCHYSAGEGLALIRRGRKQGMEIQCEVSPIHLYFCQEMITPSRERYFHINPPIRPRTDRDAMMDAFLGGHIDFLATDHAPHSQEEKERGMSGLTGLDTYGLLVAWAMAEKRAPPELLARVCGENPGLFVNQFLDTFARLRGEKPSDYGRGFGFIQPGFVASFTVINTKNILTLEARNLKTKAGHSPFEGTVFPGQVEATFVRGKKR